MVEENMNVCVAKIWKSQRQVTKIEKFFESNVFEKWKSMDIDYHR